MTARTATSPLPVVYIDWWAEEIARLGQVAPRRDDVEDFLRWWDSSRYRLEQVGGNGMEWAAVAWCERARRAS